VKGILAMTEPQQFDWIPGWQYDTRDGRKATCAIAMEDGWAVFFDRNLGTSWIVNPDGSSVMRAAIFDIVAGPDVPEDEAEMVAEYDREQEEIERRQNTAAKAERCAYNEGYRMATKDAAQVLIECCYGLDRSAVAFVVRRLMDNHLTPKVEPPF